MTRVAAMVAVLLIGLDGCMAGTPAPNGQELAIFAAASLTKVLPALEEAFGTEHPHAAFTESIGSSAAVATQIEQGAPADLFFSADLANAQRLVDGGLTSGEPRIFATNRLEVIVPAANPAGIRSPADLARPGVKVVAAADAVPITKYANRVVDNLAATDGYPAGFADAYRANVVSREIDVSGVVTKVSLGEADAGIVYATDAAAASDRVLVIPIPPAANVVAKYAAVRLSSAADPTLADAFLAWLETDDGQAVLARFGFF